MQTKVLVFSEYAWKKIEWFLHKAKKLEFSGFGITAEDDPLYVEDFITIDQECTGAETLPDDEEMAKYLGRMAKKGIDPHRCMRVWIHTHPCATTSPNPSGVDIKTLAKLSGGDWAMMIIFGRGMCVMAKMSVKLAMPGTHRVEVPLDVEVEYNTAIEDANAARWTKEFDSNVHEAAPFVVSEILTPTAGKRGSGRPSSHSPVDEGKGGYYPGYQPPITKYYQEWHSNNSVLIPINRYALARDEGYTERQIEVYGMLVFQQRPVRPTIRYFEHLLVDSPAAEKPAIIKTLKEMSKKTKNGKNKRERQTPPDRPTPKQVKKALKAVRRAQAKEQRERLETAAGRIA